MLGPAEKQFAVDFVRANDNIILQANFRHADQILARIYLTRRVVGMANQEHPGLCAFKVDRPLENININCIV